MQGSLGRTLVLTVLAAGTIAASLAGTAVAQDGRWWEAFPGFGGQDRRPRRASDDEGRRRGEAIDDLRPDSTPFRSDIMIEALEGAIQRYQRIVANGGWPAIPGSRMIRPEDDDERMPVLRQRLMISGELARRQADWLRLRLQRGPRGRRAPLPVQPRAARHRPRRQADPAGAERPCRGPPRAAARQPGSDCAI